MSTSPALEGTANHHPVQRSTLKECSQQEIISEHFGAKPGSAN